MCFVRKCSMFLRSILLTKKFLTLPQVTLYLSYEVLLSIGQNDFENIKWLLTMEYDNQMALSHIFFKVLHNTSCSCIWEIFVPTRESNINTPKEYFKKLSTFTEYKHWWKWNFRQSFNPLKQTPTFFLKDGNENKTTYLCSNSVKGR